MSTPTKADEFFKSYFTPPYDRRVMNIEYSVLSDFHGRAFLAGNTEMHFRKSLEEGFDGLKADMRFTSDGEIVLCHDGGYTFDANGRITKFDRENCTPIHDLPIDQVRALEFDQPFEGQTLHPCTLDTMLAVCEELDAIPYLTLRPEPWRPEVAKRMVELILKHNLQHRTIINLFTGVKEAMECVESLLPGLVYCNTRLGTDALTKELIDSSVADGYKIICICQRMFDTITAENVSYAASKGIHIWNWGAGNIELVAANLTQGVTGFQMYNREANNAVIAKLLHQ
ncbi:MAG: hypothetical protein IJT83_16720 [Victivallales bacterium]|nr:hypothetical protein [Victivallales bacterium]